MKAAAFFAAAERLPFASIADLTRGGGLLVVAPHPDDESLGCGGLIAAACKRGIAVRVIVVSDGTGSHPASRRFPPQQLRELREAETLAAVAELGLDAASVRFLRLPDTQVPTAGPAADSALDAIVAAAVACRAGAICVTWASDPHCDHTAAAELVRQASARVGGARVYFFPVWGWTLPPDAEVGPEPRGCRVDITDHLVAKAAAIAAHQSQTTDLIDDDPNGFRLEPATLTHFARPFETFFA